MRAPASPAPRPARHQQHSGPASTRTRRSRPYPQPPSTPPHDGHPSSPPASCRSTAPASPFTVSTTPPSVNPAALPRASPKRSRGGPRPTRPAHRAGQYPARQPRQRRPAASATPVTRTRDHTVTSASPATHASPAPHRSAAAANEPAPRPAARIPPSASSVPPHPLFIGILNAAQHGVVVGPAADQHGHRLDGVVVLLWRHGPRLVPGDPDGPGTVAGRPGPGDGGRLFAGLLLLYLPGLTLSLFLAVISPSYSCCGLIRGNRGLCRG